MNCVICGKAHHRRSDYCSEACYMRQYYQAHRDKIAVKTRKCMICGGTIPKARAESSYCSRTCYYQAFASYKAKTALAGAASKNIHSDGGDCTTKGES